MTKKYLKKRTTTRRPKGLPIRSLKKTFDILNPFECNGPRKSKFPAQNNQEKLKSAKSSLKSRLISIKKGLEYQRKDGLFLDRRIGENIEMKESDKMLSRVIRERARRSKRLDKYQLESKEDILTHQGNDISSEDKILFDDYVEDGELDPIDTAMHFGGEAFRTTDSYGLCERGRTLGDVYRSRKKEMEDLIIRKKMEKMEKQKKKEEQVEIFEEMNEKFHELSSQLSFRKLGKKWNKTFTSMDAGDLPDEDREMNEWLQEAKKYQLERKVKAAERIKLPQEIAKEEADRLHTLEAKRLARMDSHFYEAHESDEIWNEDGLDDDTEDKVMKSRKQRINISRLLSVEEREVKEAKPSLKKQCISSEIPYIFEVPTTLDSLNDLIDQYAMTGSDACCIIRRIFVNNSVQLNKNNKIKMTQFYEVVLQRFVEISDAVHELGNGGDKLCRYYQLDELTYTLFDMTQDFPNSACILWSKKLAFFQKILTKRIITLETDDCNYVSSWPSVGMLLLMRVLGHLFPVTDFRHGIITPALLLLGQMIAQAPVVSLLDLVKGIFSAGLMIEYTKDAMRLPLEAFTFLSGVLMLFSNTVDLGPIPILLNTKKSINLRNLRQYVLDYFNQDESKNLTLSFEKEKISTRTTPLEVLLCTLRLIQTSIGHYHGNLCNAETEVFEHLRRCLFCMNEKNNRWPNFVKKLIVKTIDAVSLSKQSPRQPLQRFSSARNSELAIPTFSPQIVDLTKTSVFATEKDRLFEKSKIQHEYKSERKALSRQIRQDALLIETIRRQNKYDRDKRAKIERQKNYACLEQEQATINQQVARGGDLLRGGGTSVARWKANVQARKKKKIY